MDRGKGGALPVTTACTESSEKLKVMVTESSEKLKVMVTKNQKSWLQRALKN